MIYIYGGTHLTIKNDSTDVLAIDNFFRGWLKDQVTDKEHLRLVWSSKGIISVNWISKAAL